MKEMVITGAGVICPIGFSPETLWESIIQKKCGVHKITKFATEYYASRAAGEIHNFSILDFIKDPKQMRQPVFIQYAVAASQQALDGAQLKNWENPFPSHKLGILFGTHTGAIDIVEQIVKSLITRGPKAVNPFLFQQTVFNAAASHIGIIHKINGPVYSLPLGNNAGLASLQCAINKIELGKIDYALIGTADEYTELLHRTYSLLHILAQGDNYPELCCPFDKRRNGIVFSEGSGFLFLESLETAKQRTCTILARVLGASICSDAHKLADNDPEGSGIALAMKKCLEASPCTYRDIDFIATSALSNSFDRAEAKAIHTVFKEYAKKIPVVNINSYTGTMFSTSPIISVIVSILAMKNGILPPVLNYKIKDDECDLNIVSDFIHGDWKRGLINSFGWGGNYGSVIIEKY